jgi:hypothetical protein
MYVIMYVCMYVCICVCMQQQDRQAEQARAPGPEVAGRRRITPTLIAGQHTSAYVSIRQHTSAYVSIRQHTSAYVSIRQHTSAYVSIRVDSHSSLSRWRITPILIAGQHAYAETYTACVC